MYTTPRITWDIYAFHFTHRPGITFWIDRNLSVHLIALYFCIQRTSGTFWDILKKFGTPTFFGLPADPIVYEHDRITFAIISNVSFEKSVYEWIAWSKVVVDCGALQRSGIFYSNFFTLLTFSVVLQILPTQTR